MRGETAIRRESDEKWGKAKLVHLSGNGLPAVGFSGHVTWVWDHVGTPGGLTTWNRKGGGKGGFLSWVCAQWGLLQKKRTSGGRENAGEV